MTGIFFRIENNDKNGLQSRFNTIHKCVKIITKLISTFLFTMYNYISNDKLTTPVLVQYILYMKITLLERRVHLNPNEYVKLCKSMINCSLTFV